MDIGALWQAYGEFVDEVRSGGFRPDAVTRGSIGDDVRSETDRLAQRMIAHVARTHEELIAVAEALLGGEPARYVGEPARYAGSADLDRALDSYAARYGGLPGLADRVAETAVTLCSLAEQLRERVDRPVQTYRRDGRHLVAAEAVSWSHLLETDATTHLPGQLARLRALYG